MWPLGYWSIVTWGCSLFQRYLLPVVVGTVSSVPASSNFQSWRHTQKSKLAVMFNKVTGPLHKWCHDSKWGWRCPFTPLSLDSGLLHWGTGWSPFLALVCYPSLGSPQRKWPWAWQPRSNEIISQDLETGGSFSLLKSRTHLLKVLVF